MPSARWVLASIAATLALSAAFVAPAAQAQVRGNVTVQIGTPPPPPRYEAPPPVRAGYAWAPGYWAWDGHRHVWVGGHWERVRRGYRHYEPAHWQQGPRGGWHFQPGHWQR
jgi:hypothetical protein